MPSMTDIVQLLHTITLIGTVARRRPARSGKPRHDRTHQQRRIRDFGTKVAASLIGRALYDILSSHLPWN